MSNTLLEYRSISDMNKLILKNLHKLPHDLDLIVGIPRSGMLPANLVALYLNKPFTDIDSFIDGKIYSSGERGKDLESLNIHKVLVMDDSIASGNAMNKALKKLNAVKNQYDLIYGVVFATSESVDKVDFFCEKIDSLRVFQWNIFHHGLLQKACVDIDGVLCVDPALDDDGPIYRDYILNAPPLYVPTVPIDTIVSCRLEKYRTETEQWLKNNHINYKKLIMLNLPSKAERIKWGQHGEYKGKVAKENGNLIFIESSLAQAKTINKISGKPVFCTETFELIDGSIKTKRQLFKIKRMIANMARAMLKDNYDTIKHAFFRGGVNSYSSAYYSNIHMMSSWHTNNEEYARA